jgi:hypothetical protein
MASAQSQHRSTTDGPELSAAHESENGPLRLNQAFLRMLAVRVERKWLTGGQMTLTARSGQAHIPRSAACI